MPGLALRAVGFSLADDYRGFGPRQ